MVKGKINLDISYKSLELSYRQKMKCKRHTAFLWCIAWNYCSSPLDLKYFNKYFIKYLPFISKNHQSTFQLTRSTSNSICSCHYDSVF